MRQLRSFFSLSLLANHYPALHGLRVLAIISVVQVHVTFAMHKPKAGHLPELFKFSRSIFFGMDLFFFLSGFLIGTILLYSVKNNNIKGIGRFYLRRGFRTFPLYFFVLAMLLFFWPMMSSRGANIFREIIYLTNYGDPSFKNRVMFWGWSLSVEEHFYLAAPLFIAALHLLKSHGARLAALSVIWVAGLGSRIISAAMEDTPGNVYVATHTRFDILVAGILLAYLQHHFKKQIVAMLKNKWKKTALSAISITCLLILVFRPSFLHCNHPLFLLLSWGTITSIMYFPMIMILINSDGPFIRFLSAPIFLRLATLGYGIYLIHTPVSSIMLKTLRPLWGTLNQGAFWTILLISTLLVSSLTAYFLHLLIEKPALALRDRLTNSPN